MKLVTIISWFGSFCWMSACIIAVYKNFIDDITLYEMMIPVTAYMVYLVLFKDILYK
jgi:hypothetical protein